VNFTKVLLFVVEKAQEIFNADVVATREENRKLVDPKCPERPT